MRRVVTRFSDQDRASLFALFILIGLNPYDNGNRSINRSEPVDCQSVHAIVRYHAIRPPMDRILYVQPTLIRFHFDEHLGNLAETGRNSQKTQDRKAEAVDDRMSINSQGPAPGIQSEARGNLLLQIKIVNSAGSQSRQALPASDDINGKYNAPNRGQR
jgi:hypothetical protein